MYAFVGVDSEKLPGFDDLDFAMELLETQHVLVAPGSSFNVDYRNYFRITVLPQAKIIDDVFQRVEQLLRGMAS
jgi:alanine-synthesizing transaminase